MRIPAFSVVLLLVLILCLTATGKSSLLVSASFLRVPSVGSYRSLRSFNNNQPLLQFTINADSSCKLETVNSASSAVDHCKFYNVTSSQDRYELSYNTVDTSAALPYNSTSSSSETVRLVWSFELAGFVPSNLSSSSPLASKFTFFALSMPSSSSSSTVPNALPQQSFCARSRTLLSFKFVPSTSSSSAWSSSLQQHFFHLELGSVKTQEHPYLLLKNQTILFDLDTATDASALNIYTDEFYRVSHLTYRRARTSSDPIGGQVVIKLFGEQGYQTFEQCKGAASVLDQVLYAIVGSVMGACFIALIVGSIVLGGSDDKKKSSSASATTSKEEGKGIEPGPKASSPLVDFNYNNDQKGVERDYFDNSNTNEEDL